MLLSLREAFPCLKSEGKHCADLDYQTDGFFDAGMLLQALKANQDEKDRPNEKSFARRPSVGKKLRLSEY